MRYAHIKGGVVENIIKWDGETPFDPGDGYTLVECENVRVNIGWSFDGTSFKPIQPYPSWVWNEDIYDWEAPEPYPSDGASYVWEEDMGVWWPAGQGG
jgi:hypothetical protein